MQCGFGTTKCCQRYCYCYRASARSLALLLLWKSLINSDIITLIFILIAYSCSFMQNRGGAREVCLGSQRVRKKWTRIPDGFDGRTRRCRKKIPEIWEVFTALPLDSNLPQIFFRAHTHIRCGSHCPSPCHFFSISIFPFTFNLYELLLPWCLEWARCILFHQPLSLSFF